MGPVQGLEARVETGGSTGTSCEEIIASVRVGDVRGTGGCSLFERERSLGDLPDEVGRGIGILSKPTAPTRVVYGEGFR